MLASQRSRNPKVHRSGCSELPNSAITCRHMEYTIPAGPDPSRPLAPGEAYKECMRAIRSGPPDNASAQVYAILSLEETLRNVADRLAELVGVIRAPDR
jgi:hypothetical protein